MSEMKLFALVVTYKNLDSLKRCLNKLFLQSAHLDKIVVVNNASHDETEAYLESLKDKVEVLNLKVNTGGAGGYHYGLKYCTERGADWIWCVEDDILAPRNFARDFGRLLLKGKNDLEKVGFFYPSVLSVLYGKKMETTLFFHHPNEKYLDLHVLDKAQFAGCILNTKVIRKLGLPLREFFIYCDDWEYTTRITKKGYYGLWLNDFFVWHNDTEVRQGQPHLYRRRADVWKHFYGIRNELYILRKRNPFTFIKPFLYNLIVMPFIIFSKRKEDKFYVAFNWFWWTLKSLFLKTEIKYPDGV